MNKSRRFFLRALSAAPLLAIPKIMEAKADLTMDEAKATLEKNFEVKMGIPSFRCQTGDQYIVITAGGLKLEGEPMMGWVPTKAQAIQNWLARAIQYASTRKGTLYWREGPIVESLAESNHEKWEVYSRFVITDAPELFQTVDEMLQSERYPVGKTIYNDSNTVFGV